MSYWNHLWRVELVVILCLVLYALGLTGVLGLGAAGSRGAQTTKAGVVVCARLWLAPCPRSAICADDALLGGGIDHLARTCRWNLVWRRVHSSRVVGDLRYLLRCDRGCRSARDPKANAVKPHVERALAAVKPYLMEPERVAHGKTWITQ